MCFFLQLKTTKEYDKIYIYLKQVAPSNYKPLNGLQTKNASVLYCFYDLYILEFLVAYYKDSPDISGFIVEILRGEEFNMDPLKYKTKVCKWYLMNLSSLINTQ